jgi:MoaA/NifB/PqqE/SkfB family radical SAM enzyme
MRLLDRVTRHARIVRKNYQSVPSPPFLILFINSICNMTCEHCFYWRSLNGKDDLTKDELFALSRSLGRIENLNLSGGEPFLRPEFGEICRQFIRQNGVRQIYVPSNGYFTDRMVKQITETLKEPSLELFVAELSLDGMGEYHDRFRGRPRAFEKAMESYDALAELQQRDPRLRIHANSTATNENIDEIRRLTTYLFDRCPKMEHHNLALIRGDRKNPTLQGPGLAAYQELYAYVRRLWLPRETGRYGGIVEPMLQWAKVQTAKEQRQVFACRAGVLSAVVYANGDVSVCETHPPLGNLRQSSFPEIWTSPEAQQLRRSIACNECFCTNEVFMWPSIVYPPLSLARGLLGAKVWQTVQPLGPGEKVVVEPPAGNGTAEAPSAEAPSDVAATSAGQLIALEDVR